MAGASGTIDEELSRKMKRLAAAKTRAHRAQHGVIHVDTKTSTEQLNKTFSMWKIHAE